MPRQLTPQELEKIGESIPEPQTSSITELRGQFQQINTKYPEGMPMYLKIIIACSGTIFLILGSALGYRYYKKGCTINKLLPLFNRRAKRPHFGQNTSVSKEYFSDTCNSPWQHMLYHPRSSVVIQEMELQPMTPDKDTRPPSNIRPAIQLLEEPKTSQLNHPLQELTEATPESVAKALETTAGLDFNWYYKKKQIRCSKRVI